MDVIAALFHSVGEYITDKAVFFTDESDLPKDLEGRRPINLDAVTDEDYEFIHELIAPIFQMSANNLQEDEIRTISLALARIAWQASRQGVNIFDALDKIVLPLEATEPYDTIAGAQGHLVDKEANIEAIRNFLFNDD